MYAVWGAMVDELARGDPWLPAVVAAQARPLRVRDEILRQSGYLGVTPDLLLNLGAQDTAAVPVDVRRLRRRTRANVMASRQAVARAEAVMRRSRRIAGVHVTLSRVVFGGGRQRALVSGTRTCGPLCGSSVTLLMEKDARGRWRVRTYLDGVLF